MSNITYRKDADGTWGLYGPIADMTPGAEVTVTKRNGTTKTETVGELSTDTHDGMVFAWIAIPEPPALCPCGFGPCTCGATPQPPATATRAKPASHMCDECGTRRGHINRRDSSGIHGKVCTRCNRHADHELSFA